MIETPIQAVVVYLIGIFIGTIVLAQLSRINYYDDKEADLLASHSAWLVFWPFTLLLIAIMGIFWLPFKFFQGIYYIAGGK